MSKVKDINADQHLQLYGCERVGVLFSLLPLGDSAIYLLYTLGFPRGFDGLIDFAFIKDIYNFMNVPERNSQLQGEYVAHNLGAPTAFQELHNPQQPITEQNLDLK